MSDLNASPQNVPQPDTYDISEKIGYKFIAPPKPNMKVSIGDDSLTSLQYHCKVPPNRFQRWMMKKLLGIKVEIL